MFDQNKHMLKIVVIRCGELLWPEEKNVTTLYEKASMALGMPPVMTTSKDATHLPTPIESAKEDDRFAVNCPKCQQKTFVIHGLCRTCEDAEGGKYKTMFKCYKCDYQEKSQDHMIVWLERLGINFHNQSKQSLGIKTITDEGVK